ncbi:ATP-binding protein [Bacteroides sp.]
MARFQGVEKKAFVDNMRAKGNFFELLDAGMTFLFKHLSQSGVIKGLRREEQLEIPVEALREALTNALCHRLMDSLSGSVGISIFDDRVEIENTGHLPNELTTETIKLPHRSYPQNPIIADALYLTAFWKVGVLALVVLLMPVKQLACQNPSMEQMEHLFGFRLNFPTLLLT